jgi:tetratricopeptide (TPR) repeat protein
MKAVVVTISLFLASVPLMAVDFSTLYADAGSAGEAFYDPNTGLTAFPSLQVPSGGMYEVMGTAYTAVADDSSYLFANPAASAVLKNSELSFLHNDWISDSKVESGVYTTRYADLGIGFSGKFLYLPFTAYNDWGDPVGSGYYSESTAIANISYNFFPSYYFYGLALGINLKAAYRNVPSAVVPSGLGNQNAFTGLVDVGALTRFNFLKFYASDDRNFSIGAAVRNLGLYAEGEPLPTEAALGIAYSPFRPLTLSADFNYPFSLDPSDYPAEAWNIASGFSLALTDFFTVGGGFRYDGGDPRISIGSKITLAKISFVLDYTIDMTTQLTNPDHFSIEATLNLGDRGRADLKRMVDNYYLAGLDAYAKGNLEDAIAYWQAALKLDPTFQPAQDYLDTAKRALDLLDQMRNLRKID